MDGGTSGGIGWDAVVIGLLGAIAGQLLRVGVRVISRLVDWLLRVIDWLFDEADEWLDEHRTRNGDSDDPCG